jgi:hypothetical protein
MPPRERVRNLHAKTDAVKCDGGRLALVPPQTFAS